MYLGLNLILKMVDHVQFFVCNFAPGDDRLVGGHDAQVFRSVDLPYRVRNIFRQFHVQIQSRAQTVNVLSCLAVAAADAGIASAG